MSAQTGQHADFDLAPPRLTHRLACRRPQGHPHLISTKAREIAARSASSGSGVDPCPLATPSNWIWSCSMVRFPATCTPYHTAHALTVAPQYQLNSVAAGANGTKTAKAQPKDWNSPLVCSRSLYCARTPHT